MNESLPYMGYAYAYPHKSAYGPLNPPVPLRQAWAKERKDALFLYVHVPFCEMRCGFCNLFTRSRPRLDEIEAHLVALRRESVRVREALGEAKFARLAVGGGTPTYLGEKGLAAVFDVMESIMGADARHIPCSIETSPGTSDRATLALVRDRGVERVSIGIESFDDRDLAALGRPERASAPEALGRIRDAGIPVLNIDLIYGIPGQSVEGCLASIQEALRFAPEELYLYPLYVRPLTGLARRGTPAEDLRRELYREGRALLLDAGYRQESMRMFRRDTAPARDGLGYCCQDDGMVGLGCGARSYTSDLHYSSRYAVTPARVREILADYAGRSDAEFDLADYGVRLGPEDQRRRWVIKTLLRSEGLPLEAYAARFGSDVREDLPQLQDLERQRLVREADGVICLTPDGLELSDAIGPWLYSAPVIQRMEAYEFR